MSEAMGIKFMWQARLRKDEVGGGEETDPDFQQQQVTACLWTGAKRLGVLSFAPAEQTKHFAYLAFPYFINSSSLKDFTFSQGLTYPPS